LKPWIMEITSDEGVGFTEPVDDVTATLLVGLGKAGTHRARQLPFSRTLERHVVEQLDAGTLEARKIKLTVGGCPCGKCESKPRIEEVLVAVPLHQSAGKFASLAIMGQAGQVTSVPLMVATASQVIKSLEQLQAALPMTPVYGGFPLLNMEPSSFIEQVAMPQTPEPIVKPTGAKLLSKADSLIDRFMAWLLGPRPSEVVS
jgi:hypothetical protein